MERDLRSQRDRQQMELVSAKIDKPVMVEGVAEVGRMDMERQMGASTRIERGTTIVDVVGQIDLGNSTALRKTLLESLKGTDCVAVNLIAVKYIDSSGIASLLEVLKEARQSKKRLVLFGLTAAVNQVLQLTRLTGVFEIRDNEEQALKA
jgi:anti-sigma B factor antagonist